MSSARSSDRPLDAFELLAVVRKDPEKASKQVLSYLNDTFRLQGFTFTEARVESASKTALNSLNGQCTLADGTTLFFKFHTEEHETSALADSEMYNINVLKDARWKMIAPVASSDEPGSQCVLYPLIKEKTAYAFLADLDREYLARRSYPETLKTDFLAALGRSLDETLQNILRTLKPDDRELPTASIHQLFSHRLLPVEDETVRVEKFYETNPKFKEISKLKWIVNGKELPWTLEELVSDSKKYLAAASSMGMASVVAHGDEHFANQFLINSELVFFDPAFAGRMPALLSMVKATAHNTITHPLWFYEPDEIEGDLVFSASVADKVITVDHNHDPYQAAPIRVDIAKHYVEKAWKPLISELRQIGHLPDWWMDYVRCALFCSPLLAKNLLNEAEYKDRRYLFNFARLLESCQWMEEYILQECS